MSSSHGVRQRDPLGPALCSAALKPILSKMSLERSVVILAYLDDIYVVGPANALEQVLCDFKVVLSRIGLIICDRKCELYCPLGDQAEFSVSVSYGVTILGKPIGKPEFYDLNVLTLQGLENNFVLDSQSWIINNVPR